MPRSTASQIIRQTDLDVLVTEAREAVQGEDYDYIRNMSEDTSGSSSESGGLENAIHELRIYTRCLVDLSSALENAVMDFHYHDRTGDVKVDPLAPYHFYSNRIRDRFPLATDEVVDLLGEANLRRHQLIVKAKEEALASQAETERLERPGRPEQTEQPQQLEQPRLLTLDIKSMKSTVEGTFHDSGLGTSVPTASEQAPSLASSAVSSVGDAGKAKFPQLTRQAMLGEPFECDGCGKRLIIRVKNQWKYVIPAPVTLWVISAG